MVAISPAGGTAVFLLDGVQQQLRGSFKVFMGGFINTAGGNADGSVYATQKFEPCMVEAELNDGPAVSLSAIQALNGNTVTLQLVNGKVYIVANAFLVDKVELDAVEGKFGVKFSGASCTELLP